MRGHIQQRGKQSWRIKAYVGRDEAGVRRYVERTVRGSRREAEREMSRLLVEVDEGRHAAAAPITVGKLLDRWLELKRRMVEPKTIESYEWVARRYVRPALAERKVASLRAIDLDTLYSELHKRGFSAPDSADLPHGHPSYAGTGAAVGADRSQPGGRCHATGATPSGDRAAHSGTGADAPRRG